eukprot:TRINITY_DN44556_c0_g1_i1.p1 TRINITY_DN44556_c0_g1~~TRINITY_DN44556_c0_g1_i1.p1  ORF type:complete len:597 (+),score=138.16 TRINITY_DN44556_c0_g1_i1:78-1793(+)
MPSADAETAKFYVLAVCGGGIAVASALAGGKGMLYSTLAAAMYVAISIRILEKNAQLVISCFTEEIVVNGPRLVIVPLFVWSAKRREPCLLGPLEYCIVTSRLTGDVRIEKGPRLLFLAAYEDAGSKQDVISLTATQFVRFLDRATGKVRVEVGEQGIVIPTAHEVLLDKQGKRQAISLKVFEYVKIEDKRTGNVRVERGEKLVFLTGFEEVIDEKQRAVEIDDETAVLVRNKRSGQQKLATEKQLFVPTADEEVIEVRKLIKLADYEACIVRGKDGQDNFFFGCNDSQRSFFLPPHAELVVLQWSRGRRRERRDLLISKIDLRPIYMSFEFNCRTSDNVELVLEGSFFWEVKDLKAMVKFTGDTTGDICNHARSKFIELVSQVKLQEFMSDFNSIAEKVHRGDDTFYTQRGVQIHSLEVTGYRCANQSTADTLQQIIQETTNRMNRLQQQESENEVQLFQIQGDIEEERARKELLDIQTANNATRAKMEGLGEAERVRSFLTSLQAEVPALDTRTELWRVLRKGEVLNSVSKGNARLYFTPQDVSLSLESHDHVHMDTSSGSSFQHVPAK